MISGNWELKNFVPLRFREVETMFIDYTYVLLIPLYKDRNGISLG